MNAMVSDQREETIWRERDRSNKDSVTGLGEKCCPRFAKVYTGASGWMWEGEDEHPRESCILLCFYKGKREICTQLKVQPVQKGREIKSNSQFFHLFFVLSPQRLDLYFLVSTLKKKKKQNNYNFKCYIHLPLQLLYGSPVIHRWSYSGRHCHFASEFRGGQMTLTQQMNHCSRRHPRQTEMPVNSCGAGWERHHKKSPKTWDPGLALPLTGLQQSAVPTVCPHLQ